MLLVTFIPDHFKVETVLVTLRNHGVITLGILRNLFEEIRGKEWKIKRKTTVETSNY